MKPDEKSLRPIAATAGPALFAAIMTDTSSTSELVQGSLNHLHIAVKDLDTSQQFYEAHFGFKPSFEGKTDDEKPVRFLRNRRGDLLALERWDEGRPEIPKWFHIGIELPSSDAVRKAVEHFRVAHVTILEDPKIYQRYATVTIEDPDGYHIQIYWDGD